MDETHTLTLRSALRKEREAAVLAMRREIALLSPEEREKRGRALLGLSGKYVGREVGGLHLVRFGRERAFGETEIRVGDVVLVSSGRNPLRTGIEGTVTEITSRSLVVAFSEAPPLWMYKENIRVDLYVNDVAFRRMEEALSIVEGWERTHPLKSVLLGLGDVPKVRPCAVTFVDEGLNPSQQEAVQEALAAPVLFLVHGPPGTGKTRTIVEYIVQEVRRGHRVLATADSNTACDNILLGVARKNLKVVRVGHPARVEKELLAHALFVLAAEKPPYQEAMRLWEEIAVLKREQSRYLRPSPCWRRGLSDAEIRVAALEGKSLRGIPLDKIRSMGQYLLFSERIEELAERARTLESAAISQVLEEAEVVVTTNIGAGSDFLQGRVFDVVVIDEGSQATEPSALVALVRGKKLVMSGDHQQLPPTVLSLEAQPILSQTLFERLIRTYPQSVAFLNIQYRMHEDIMAFPNEAFYEGRLVAAPEVARRTLRTLGILPQETVRHFLVVDPEKPLVFLDTALCPDRLERRHPGSTSLWNPLEVELVTEIVGDFLALQVPPEWIGIITPYDDQVAEIAKRLPGIRVSTVDGFQGQEREIIVLSLVRSNLSGEVGFLSDARRLNVAITRARAKLVVIGDSTTLSRDDLWKTFLDFVRKRGRYLTLSPRQQ
nr:IGHMBP2 family helicase [Candidatus Calescibacterium sp.]